MNKTLFSVLVALCLAISAHAACDTGFVELDSTTATANSISSDVNCVECNFGCKACDEDLTCNDLLDLIDGAEIDSSGTIVGNCDNNLFTYGYNPEDETCEMCADGCTSCLYDYDVCGGCRVGWDYNRGGRACLRATLGLTAVNFVLSVLILAGAILTCLKASKLQ